MRDTTINNEEDAMQYRQGDVFLRSARIPAAAKVVDPDGGRIVLAYGEVTGHAHAIHEIDRVAILEGPDGRRWLRVTEAAALSHEEHATVVVPPGEYEITIQREYAPGAVRNVAD
jgi:hypothetical protein